MFKLVGCDTDSIKFCNFDGSEISEFDINKILKLMNDSVPDGIILEKDGYYDKFVVVKSKNYITKDFSGKIKIRGSALKATMKEPALQEFIDEVINELLEGDSNGLVAIYNKYVRDCGNLTVDTIARWSSKKTITKAVLTPKRTNEQRVWDAIKAAGKSVQEGDKIYIYFKSATELSLKEKFDGTYDRKKLLGKLFKTVEIFKTIIVIKQFPNYSLKKHESLVNNLSK